MKTLYGVGAETFDEILKTNRSFEALQDIETSTDLNADDPEASVVKFVNRSSAKPFMNARPIFTSNRSRMTFEFVIASTASSRGRRPAAIAPAPIGHHLAFESHGAHGYRGAPSPTGWPDQSGIRRPED